MDVDLTREWEQALLGWDQPPNRQAVSADQAPGVVAGGFDSWVSAVRPRVVALAKRLLWNGHDAEEVAQEALLLAWRNMDRLREKRYLNTWIYRATVNLCLSRLRRKKPVDAALEQLPSPGDDPSAGETLSELAVRVRWAIARLPEQLQVAIVLRDLEGLAYEEMAPIAKTRVSTVRLRVHRAREKVRQLLLERWPDTFGNDR